MRNWQDRIRQNLSYTGRRELIGWFLHQFQPFWFFTAQHYRQTLLSRTKIVTVVGSYGKTTTPTPHPSSQRFIGTPLDQAVIMLLLVASHALCKTA